MLEKSEYYSRQKKLSQIGTKGQSKLDSSKVLVIGAGGTGCAALNYLVAAGIGEVGICDFDVIAASNLHRQPLYTVDDIGRKKAVIAAERLGKLNPFVRLNSISEKFERNSSAKLVEGYDLILDCTDNLTAKFAVADACRESKKPLIQASIHGFDGQLLMWRPSSEAESSNKTASVKSQGQCYRCLWPSEERLQTDGRDCIDSCAESGVIGVVPGVLGSLQATEAIKFLLDLPTPLIDHVLFFDLLTCSTKLVKTKRSATCPECGSVESSDRSQLQSSKVDDKLENADNDNDNEFELHWSVLRSRSPRELVYVDIRSASERKADTATASKLSGRNSLVWNLDELDVEQLKLDRNSTYLIMCQRGLRSAKLVRQLRQLGHKNVFSLSQGASSMVSSSSSSMELTGEKTRV